MTFDEHFFFSVARRLRRPACSSVTPRLALGNWDRRGTKPFGVATVEVEVRVEVTPTSIFEVTVSISLEHLVQSESSLPVGRIRVEVRVVASTIVLVKVSVIRGRVVVVVWRDTRVVVSVKAFGVMVVDGVTVFVRTSFTVNERAYEVVPTFAVEDLPSPV